MSMRKYSQRGPYGQSCWPFRLGSPAAQAIVHSFPHGDAQAEADGCSLTVRNLDIVTVVEIKTDK